MSTPTTQPVYGKAYFIAKFEAIPEERWTECGQYMDHEGRCCARGHLGESNTNTPDSSRALTRLFKGHGYVTAINDGRDSKYQQPTPRARMLAALRDLPN